ASEDAAPGSADDAMRADGMPGDELGVGDGGEDATTTDATTTDATLGDAPIESSSDATSDGAPETDTGVTDAGVDAAPLDCTLLGASGEPLELGCTGLYASWETRTIASDLLAFDPGIHLWSDGAAKSRWIRLPAGQKIDTSNMDEWTFPAGTRFWKEFRLGGLKVETRMLWKQTTSNFSWVRVTYAWSQDQSTATELTTGQTNVWGTTYEIPSQNDCTTCHQGRLDGVLGFEAIGLSSAGATGETMARLIADALITDAPATPLVIPGNATESAALGWLHANCGNSCHSASNYALAINTGFRMRLNAAQLSTVTGTDTYTTAVNVASTYQPTPDAGLLRIKPADPAHSCVHYRDGSRVPSEQMPPLGTHIVDVAGLQLVDNWINTL
ncbi:MAG: hypothetical protein ABIP89_00080, partial [Polyangiaceae bacterium]